MKVKGPVVTLIVGVIIAAIMLLLDVHAKSAQTKAPASYGMSAHSTSIGGAR